MDNIDSNNNMNTEKVILKDETNKEIIDQIRKLKAELIEIDEIILKSSMDLIAYLDNNKQYQMKNSDIEQEIIFRTNQLDILLKRYSSIFDPGNDISKKFISEIRDEIILNRVKTAFNNKFELFSYNEDHLLQHCINSEYQLLIFESVNVKYSNLENINIFISKTSTFKELKSIVCSYYQIDNINDYIILDEGEGYIQNEEAIINDYLEIYSIFSNNFILADLTKFKQSSSLNINQESRITQQSMVSRTKNKMKLVIGENKDFDKKTKLVGIFYLDYPMLEKYKAKEITQTENCVKLINSDNKDYSFIIILISFLFYIFTILNLITVDLKKGKFIEKFVLQNFDHSNVSSSNALFRYIFEKLLVKKYHYLLFNKNANDVKLADYESLSNAFNMTVFFNNGKFNNTAFNEKMIILVNQTQTYSLVSDLVVSTYYVSETTCQKNIYYSSSVDKVKCIAEEYLESANGKNFTDTRLIYYDKSSLFKDHSPFKLSLSGELNYQENYIFQDLNPNTNSILDALLFLNHYIDLEEETYNGKLFTNTLNRGLTFYFTLFFPSIEEFVAVNINFQNTGLGYLESGEIKINSFNPDYYLKFSYMKVIDILRMCMIIFLLIHSLYKLYKFLRNRQNTKFSYSILYYILLSCLVAYILHEKQEYQRYSSQDFFKTKDLNKTIINSTVSTNVYSQIIYIDSIILFIFSFKIISFFKINESFNMITANIMFSLRRIMFIALVLLLYIIILAMIFNLLFSGVSQEYIYFSKSFSKVLFMLCGQLNFNKLAIYWPGWVFVLALILFIVIIFFSASIIIAILIEHNRIVIVENYQRICIEKSWLIKDYLKWILCLKDHKENNLF